MPFHDKMSANYSKYKGIVMSKIYRCNIDRLIENPDAGCSYNTILFVSGAPSWDNYAYGTNLSEEQRQDFVNTVKMATDKDVCWCECEIYYNREKIELQRWCGAKIKELPKWWTEPTYLGFKPNQLIIQIHNYGIRYDREPDCPNKRTGFSDFYGTSDALYNCIEFIEQGKCNAPIVNKFIGKLLFPEKYPDKSKIFNFTEQELSIPVENMGLNPKVVNCLKEMYHAKNVRDLIEIFNARGYLNPVVIAKLEHMQKTSRQK